jgi:hypothetical protein
MESTPSHALVKLKNALKRDWGPRRFKIVPKPCEQQKSGSNDCGLACVNAAATQVGGRLLSRDALPVKQHFTFESSNLPKATEVCNDVCRWRMVVLVG